MTTCTPRAAWVTLLRRLHFSIGLFVGPFIFVAALTGTLYVATPQLEEALYSEALQGTEQGEPQSLAAQIALAQQVVGNHLPVYAVRPALEPERRPGSCLQTLYWPRLNIGRFLSTRLHLR